MAPVDNPQLIMYVAVKAEFICNTNRIMPVSEVFKDVMSKSLKYLNTNPENAKKLKRSVRKLHE